MTVMSYQVLLTAEHPPPARATDDRRQATDDRQDGGSHRPDLKTRMQTAAHVSQWLGKRFFIWRVTIILAACICGMQYKGNGERVAEWKPERWPPRDENTSHRLQYNESFVLVAGNAVLKGIRSRGHHTCDRPISMDVQ